jgi:hypothetical protein
VQRRFTRLPHFTSTVRRGEQLAAERTQPRHDMLVNSYSCSLIAINEHT